MTPKTPSTIEKLFADRPASLKLYKVVKKFIQSLGPVEIEVTKTQVSFEAKTKFAWVWLPQTWITKRAVDSLTVTFDVDHEVKDTQIAEAVEVRPGRWTHHVIIENEADFDGKVKDWIRESYALGQIDRRHKAT